MKQQIKYSVMSMGLIFILMISGCFIPYSHHKIEMFTQIFHAIPINLGDLHLLKSEVIETDKYGRRLFAFSTSDSSGYCILQKTDDSYAYYYDNISFQLRRESERISVLIDEYAPEDVEELKVKNDWDKELDESKMVKKAFMGEFLLSKSRKSVISEEKITKLLNSNFENKYYDDYDFFFCDYSQTGQELFNIRGEYLMILNADGTYNADHYLMKIDDWEQINSLLAEIKKNNGWVS